MDWGQGAFLGVGTNGVGFDGLGQAGNGLWEAGHKPFVNISRHFMTCTSLIPIFGSVGRWMTLYEMEAGWQEKLVWSMVYYA